MKTSVWASRSRSLRTNFGRTTRATTSEAGRRSIVSLTSSPMRSNASRPSFSTSGGAPGSRRGASARAAAYVRSAFDACVPSPLDRHLLLRAPRRDRRAAALRASSRARRARAALGFPADAPISTRGCRAPACGIAPSSRGRARDTRRAPAPPSRNASRARRGAARSRRHHSRQPSMIDTRSRVNSKLS